MLAAVNLSDGEGTGGTSIYLAEAGRWEWEPRQGDFGPGDAPNQVFSLARTAGGAWIAGGEATVVARSTDGGARWESVWGSWWGSGLGTHDLKQCGNTLWAGGERGYFAPLLIASHDEGVSWHEVTRPSNNGDNAVISLECDRRNNAGVIAGMEGRVVHSRDEGRTWVTLLQPPEYPYFFGLGASAIVAGRFYAAGATNRPMQPTVLYAGTMGSEWSAFVAPFGNAHGGVWSLLVRAENRADAVYLGTGAGVVRFAPRSKSP
jgi:hypothetical protein